MNLGNFLSNLTLLFIYLQYAGFIEWSWMKILSPLFAALFLEAILSWLRSLVSEARRISR